MNVIKNSKGNYSFKHCNEDYILIKCDLLKTWSIYGFGNRMFAGGCTKKEALINFSNKTKE